MANVIKTVYMGKSTQGSDEYVFKDDESRMLIHPYPGDKASMQDGRVFFCWDKGIWEEIQPVGGVSKEYVDNLFHSLENKIRGGTQ